jgi:hypothetical protein
VKKSKTVKERCGDRIPIAATLIRLVDRYPVAVSLIRAGKGCRTAMLAGTRTRQGRARRDGLRLDWDRKNLYTHPGGAISGCCL